MKFPPVALLWLVALTLSSPLALAASASASDQAAQGVDAQASLSDINELPPPPLHCERVVSSLNYNQATAPRDITSVQRVIYDKLNRDLGRIVEVKVHYTGADLHNVVGTHIVTADVYRKDAQGNETKECFEVPFAIDDVDECNLDRGHSMRHKCDDSSVCRNTEGSYECECEDEGVGGLSLKSSTCPLSQSTEGCCTDVSCKAAFMCPVDPCLDPTLHSCDTQAGSKCAPKIHSDGSQPSYTCTCPEGKLGSGFACTVSDARPVPRLGHDGKTNKKNSMFCSCTKPVIDVCDGFPGCTGKNQVCTVDSEGKPKCECSVGFVNTTDHGCIDETPPVLVLNGPGGSSGSNSVLRLKQGDHYEEYGVTVNDNNLEDFPRTIATRYSDVLPSGCLMELGKWHVNYTMQTPWTEPPFQSITRTIVVEDIDECKLSADASSRYCKEVIPMCDVDRGAVCKNTIGSYTCQCPMCTKGDGFLSIPSVKVSGSNAPVGYAGGNGCVDNCKPTIHLAGPNPRVFRACKCAGLVGLTKEAKRIHEEHDHDQDGARNYDSEIKELAKAQGGAELCATKDNAAVVTSMMCASADDVTVNGKVDLTSKIVVSDPVRHPTKKNAWRVAYNVVDAAGNRADTVWRDVVVEELSFTEYEAVLRKELHAEKEKEIRLAVDKATRKEKAACSKEVADATNEAKKDLKNNRCPACPECFQNECNCEGDVGDVLRDLHSCQNTAKSGRFGGFNVVSTLEQVFPLLVLLIIGLCSLGLVTLILQSAFGGQRQGGAARNYDNGVPPQPQQVMQNGMVPFDSQQLSPPAHVARIIEPGRTPPLNRARNF
jgi:hypothetical protein